jgi:NADH-quinone oxidoreductase subunit N
MAEWQTLLIFSSLASMILGSFAGLSQGRIKRLLAYSSIGHVGYLWLLFAVEV